MILINGTADFIDHLVELLSGSYPFDEKNLKRLLQQKSEEDPFEHDISYNQFDSDTAFEPIKRDLENAFSKKP